MKKYNICVKLIQRTPVYRGKFIRKAYIKGLKHDNKKNFSFLNSSNKDIKPIRSIKKMTQKN